MAGLDLFGLKKEAPADDAPAAPPAEPAAPLPRKAWTRLIAVDAALAVAFAVVVGLRVKSHLGAASGPSRQAPAKGQAAKVPPAPKAPETKKPEPPKPEPPKPEAKKPEPPKSEAKKPEPKPAAPKEAEKKPLGSPAVHAGLPPVHQAAPKAAAKASKTEAAAPAGKKATRPVPFSFEDAQAKEVYLVGPFLVRSGGRKMMFKDSKGVWQTTVYLNVGQTYKYRIESVGPGGHKLSSPRKVEVLADN